MNVREIWPGTIWVLEEPLRFFGIEIGRRMTVIRLASGELLIHSPARLDPPTQAWLVSLGEPRFFLCPNQVHDANIERPFEVFPQAKVFAPPGTSRHYRGLPFAGVLDEQPDQSWAEWVDQTLFQGIRFITEADFFHSVSKTLILADICFNVQEDAALGTKLVFRLLKMYGKLSVPLDMRVSIRDRAAAQRSVQRMLEWDFDRIIVGHGAIVETDGRMALQRAFSWLM